MKTIFKCLILATSFINCHQVAAQAIYETWFNGEVQDIDGRLYTKVVLSGKLKAESRIRMSIARLYGQRNFLKHPYKNLLWKQKYYQDDQRILTSNYFRIEKLSSEIDGIQLEKKWIQDGNYSFVFSVPAAQLEQMDITPSDIISSLQQAVINKNNKLDIVSILEISLRHQDVFDMASVVNVFSARYGANLLKFLSGIPVEDVSEWQGPNDALTQLNLEDLLRLQSRYPYEHDIALRLTLALQEQNYTHLPRRVIEYSLKSSSTTDAYTRLTQLADRLGISYTLPVP